MRACTTKFRVAAVFNDNRDLNNSDLANLSDPSATQSTHAVSVQAHDGATREPYLKFAKGAVAVGQGA